MNASDWLLVSDIDGTLITKARHLPVKNRDAVARFVKNGGHFTLCSGRNLQSLTPHYRKLDLTAPAIFLNGAGIYDFGTKKMLSYEPFSDEEERAILATVATHTNMDTTIFTPDRLYLLNPVVFGRMAARADHLEYVVCHSAAAVPHGVWGKVTVFGAHSALLAIKAELESCGDHLFDFFFTSKLTLEVSHHGTTKGSAVQKLAAILGIDPQNVGAIGDYYNDTDMLKAVAHPVCCGQAPSDIKAIAEHVACHCRDGAVADFINYIETTYISQS